MKKGVRNKWESLHPSYDIAERCLFGTKQLFMKLGQSNIGSFPNVEKQVNCKSFNMPRLSSSEMNDLRKQLRYHANVLITNASIRRGFAVADNETQSMPTAVADNETQSMPTDAIEEAQFADETIMPPSVEIESVAAVFRDATQMSDELIPTLQCRLFQETKRRSKNERLPSFTLKSNRGE
jgi:hypothetical protein